jgi:hypothetical protein
VKIIDMLGSLNIIKLAGSCGKSLKGSHPPPISKILMGKFHSKRPLRCFVKRKIKRAVTTIVSGFKRSHMLIPAHFR